MVSALKWESASTSIALVTSGDALATSTISAASTEYDNSVNLNTYGWLEFTGTWSDAAPFGSNPTVDIYIAQAPDGTNYQDAPLTGGTNQTEMYLISIPVQSVTTTQRVVVGPVPLPPHKFQLYADNRTGRSLDAGWTLNLFTNNLEAQ